MDQGFARGVMCHVTFFVWGGGFRHDRSFSGPQNDGNLPTFLWMFRGADIHPKPCDVLPVEIGGLRKKFTIFFIVDDFFNNKKSGFLLPAW